MTQLRSDAGAEAGETVRLHVESRGSGPTLLLMHGFSGSARNFRAQARALGEAYRVLLFDARGHARSEAPERPGAYSIDCFVGDALRVLDEAGAGRAVVGGLSMGAAVALELARRQPERLAGLVLASFPAGPRVGGISARALDFAESIEAEGLEAAGARYVWGPSSGLDARAAALVRQGFLEHPPHGLAHTLRELLARLPEVEASAAELARCALPSLIVAGQRDLPSLAASRALASALPGAELRILPEAGHLVNLEQPAVFEAALRDFLERAAPG